jgi:hypothetical protein
MQKSRFSKVKDKILTTSTIGEQYAREFLQKNLLDNEHQKTKTTRQMLTKELVQKSTGGF